jgi:putative ATP-dependent endonuclease of the OLD family
LVLSPRWNVTFTDADLHNCNTEEPIVLQLVIGDLPARLLRDDANGYDLCGLTPDGNLIEEPANGSESCVMIQWALTRRAAP